MANPEDLRRVSKASERCRAIVGAGAVTTASLTPHLSACAAVWREEAGGPHEPFDLSGADLHDGCFVQCDSLQKANLSGANLDRSLWVFARLEGADLHGTTLRGASMTNTYCNGTNFRNADLTGASLGIQSNDPQAPADFSGANLQDAKLICLNVPHLDLRGANVTGLQVILPDSYDEVVKLAQGPLKDSWNLENALSTLSEDQRAQVKIVKGSKKCYIATAACGGENAAEVDQLRTFRDRILRPTSLGSLFIRAYEAVSPAMAERIAGSASLARLTRALVIRPAAFMARRFLTPGGR